MKKHDMYSLLAAFGYTKQLDDPQHCRTRFKHDETGFLDLWIGRKKITVGIYNPEGKAMKYRKVNTLVDLEDFLAA